MDCLHGQVMGCEEMQGRGEDDGGEVEDDDAGEEESGRRGCPALGFAFEVGGRFGLALYQGSFEYWLRLKSLRR